MASLFDRRTCGGAEHLPRGTSSLTLLDLLVAVVDAGSEKAIAPVVDAIIQRVAARAGVLVLAFAPRFDLVVHGAEAGLATRLVLRAP